MELTHFRPRSTLVTRSTRINRPQFPVIDVHNHLSDVDHDGVITIRLERILSSMDEAGVSHLVDLDGGWGERILQHHLEKLADSDRFRFFGGVDWTKWVELGDAFPEYAAKRLAVQKSWGASGLKIWKQLGLEVRDQAGALVRVDDPRLFPIWQAAGELGLPVLVHVADPVAFFDPVDETNERWDELLIHPEWAFTSPPCPPFLEILNGFFSLVRQHPGTIFIGAHVGCYAENLEWVGRMLEACPNYYIDIAGRTGDLGRQPYSARRFFMKHPSRILFGLDEGLNVEAYRLVYRFLETEDEYFNYNLSEIPRQGRWQIYGLHLPQEVLQQVYHENATALLGLT